MISGVDLQTILEDYPQIVDCGYTTELTPESYGRYDRWVQKKGHGPLHYLADYRKDKRKSLKAYYPECESALVFLFSYADGKKALDDFYQGLESNGLKVASYTLGFNGQDYHYVIKEWLGQIGQRLAALNPDLDYKLTLDVHPVLERDLAYRSGLGWFGKNSMFISKEHGSFVLLGSLLLNQRMDLKEKAMDIDHCGNCRACIDICPTNAIDIETRTIITSECISTYTIELFKEEDTPPKIKWHGGEIFGCDLCQDVCPWNKKVLKAITAQSELLNTPFGQLIKETFLTPSPAAIKAKLEGMSGRAFTRLFKGTSFERSGKRGLLKTLRHLFYLD